jgi:hypothetical protein
VALRLSGQAKRAGLSGEADELQEIETLSSLKYFDALKRLEHSRHSHRLLNNNKLSRRSTAPLRGSDDFDREMRPSGERTLA